MIDHSTLIFHIFGLHMYQIFLSFPSIDELFQSTVVPIPFSVYYTKTNVEKPNKTTMQLCENNNNTNKSILDLSFDSVASVKSAPYVLFLPTLVSILRFSLHYSSNPNNNNSNNNIKNSKHSFKNKEKHHKKRKRDKNLH